MVDKWLSAKDIERTAQNVELQQAVGEKIMQFITQDNPNKPYGIEILLPELKAVVSLATSGNIRKDVPEFERLIKKASDIGLTNNNGHVDKETKQVISDFLKYGPSNDQTLPNGEIRELSDDFVRSMKELTGSMLSVAQPSRMKS